MQKLTQTQPDNCWQTCVAMLLGCPAESLPDQHAIGYAGYARALQVYLHKHHGAAYVEVGPEMFDAVAAERICHLMIGETVRTSPEHDAWHAIVGVAGEPHWDVHPSRAGLTKAFKMGVLVPFPDAWRADWERMGMDAVPCSCPACAVETATTKRAVAS